MLRVLPVLIIFITFRSEEGFIQSFYRCSTKNSVVSFTPTLRFCQRQVLSRDKEESLNAQKKQRIDDILLERGLCATREEIKALLITKSILLSDGEIVSSLSTKIDQNAEIRLRFRKNEPYVSRAGRKLSHAIQKFSLSNVINDSICIDLGASTGGFSDVLLQNNCSIVYAVDVGVSLLDWKIRSNPRVTIVEKQNARYLNSSQILHSGNIGVVVCDVSFISLKLVLPPSLIMCKKGALLLALIKPQFECRRHELGEGGIVRDDAVRNRVVNEFSEWMSTNYPSWEHIGIVESPITGQNGNIEYIFVGKLV